MDRVFVCLARVWIVIDVGPKKSLNEKGLRPTTLLSAPRLARTYSTRIN
jgi:hypothetical protein